MSALLLVVGLAAAPVPSCDGKVLVLHSTYGTCITPAAANLILVGAGQSQRIDVGPDGQAFIVWPTLW